MSRVLCLLERGGGGAGGGGGALTGVRLFDGREVRGLEVAGGPGAGVAEAAGGAGAVDPAVVKAAAWIAEQLGPNGARGVLTLVVDAGPGARCQWLSAPGRTPAVVEAAVRELAYAGGDDGSERHGVWAAAHGEAGMDLSVQPLVERGGTAGEGDGETRPRLGVLAVPDLAARALIDELDRRGVVVDRCLSVWHALAAGWDPARARDLGAGLLGRADGDGGTLAGAATVAASVVIEGRGRLLWTWSRAGVLLAAGTMRLRAARQGDAGVVEVSRSEVGRVVGEWLGWSVQLGVAPGTVGVIGPDTVTCAGLEADLPEVPGVAAVARALGAQWPGAVVSAHVEADGVGAALARLAAGDEAPDPAGAVLSALTARPVRATRRMYAWSAAALGGVALLLAALAWKVDAAAARLAALREEQVEARRKAVAEIKPLVDVPVQVQNPVEPIRRKTQEILKTRADMTPERPILAAFAQIAAAVDAVPGAKFREKERISITSVGGITARFSVPDAQTGPNLLIALRENLGPPRIDWQGSPGGTAENRTYNIAGTWVDAKAGAGGVGGGK